MEKPAGAGSITLRIIMRPSSWRIDLWLYDNRHGALGRQVASSGGKIQIPGKKPDGNSPGTIKNTVADSGLLTRESLVKCDCIAKVQPAFGGVCSMDEKRVADQEPTLKTVYEQASLLMGTRTDDHLHELSCELVSGMSRLDKQNS
jgi:hypothetical protein